MSQLSAATHFSRVVPAEADAEHPCVWCPCCARKLESSRCKLVCRHCGYYMSCADYY